MSAGVAGCMIFARAFVSLAISEVSYHKEGGVSQSFARFRRSDKWITSQDGRATRAGRTMSYIDSNVAYERKWRQRLLCGK